MRHTRVRSSASRRSKLAETSRIPLADQVREWNADALLLPSTEHVDVLTLHAVMMVADVETVEPRLSFARWAIHPEVRSR